MQGDKRQSIDSTIHDLKVLQDYYEYDTAGCTPSCLPDAIEYLKELKRLKEEQS